MRMNGNQEKYHDQIDAYFRGEFSEQQKISFKKLLNEDSELLQEFLIHKGLYAQFNKEDRIECFFSTNNKELKDIERYYQSDEVHNLKNTINWARVTYRQTEKQKSPNRNLMISLAAAASIVLFIVFYSLNSQNTTQELYAKHSNWENLPSLTSRGEDNDLSMGQLFFEEHKYEQSYDIFKTFKKTKKEVYPSVLIYLGISSLELNKHDEAIFYFDQLINSETIDQSKGYWYKTLIYLKLGRKDDAIQVLEVLITNENNYNHQEASKLLKKLR